MKDTPVFLHSNLITKILWSTDTEMKKFSGARVTTWPGFHRAWVNGCPWVFTVTVSGEDGKSHSTSISSQLNPVLVQCRTATELHWLQKLWKSFSKAWILSTFKKTHKVIWTQSMHFLADERVMISLFLMTEKITASNGMGEGANLLSFFTHTLVQPILKTVIDVFWMFLTSIWQQSAIHKAEVLAKAWWPATLLDPSKVKVLLKAWRKESASTTLMHKSLSSDEW